MMGFEVFDGALPADLLALLAPEEAAIVAETSARDDTFSFIVRDGVALLGYAVCGHNAAEKMMIVYAARSFNSFVAKMAMQGLFGASQVVGSALRVHVDKIAPFARMIGAGKFIDALDGDGLRVGVFDGV